MRAALCFLLIGSCVLVEIGCGRQSSPVASVPVNGSSVDGQANSSWFNPVEIPGDELPHLRDYQYDLTALGRPAPDRADWLVGSDDPNSPRWVAGGFGGRGQ